MARRGRGRASEEDFYEEEQRYYRHPGKDTPGDRQKHVIEEDVEFRRRPTNARSREMDKNAFNGHMGSSSEGPSVLQRRIESLTKPAYRTPVKGHGNTRLDDRIIHRRVKSRPRRPALRHEDEVMIREREYDSDHFSRRPRRRPAGHSHDIDVEIDHGEHKDEVFYRSRSTERQRPKTDEGEGIFIATEDKRGGRGRRSERGDVIIRRRIDRSFSPEPSIELTRSIHAPPIHQDIVTHHRHIDHGYENAAPHVLTEKSMTPHFERPNVGKRYMGVKNKKDRLWTEITKDLVAKKAIEKAGYDYEETEDFYYVFSYLRYDDVAHLVRISEDCRRAQRERIRDFQTERGVKSQPLALPATTQHPTTVLVDRTTREVEEEFYSDDDVITGPGRRGYQGPGLSTPQGMTNADICTVCSIREPNNARQYKPKRRLHIETAAELKRTSGPGRKNSCCQCKMAHIGDMATSKRTVTSCLRCRRRKIRCGRERPHCQNCIRYGYECEYLNSVAGASGYSTLDKSPANSSQSLQGHDELRNRVSHLESLVSKLVAHCGGLAAVSSTNTPPESETLPSGSRDVSEGVISDLGDLLIIDSEPRHMVGSYWRKLAAQHRDLELLLESHDQDDGVDATCETTTPGLTPSFLFAPPDPNFQPRDCLPEFQGAERLYAIFRSRVDPITRIIHKPTFETDMRAYYFNPAKLGTSPSESQQEDWKNTRTAAAFEALLFAVFYGALNSLSEEEFLQFSQVNNYVGDLNDDVLRSIVQDERQTKHSYLRIFSFALEQSLLRSQILEKPTLNSVTACCLFLFVSCAEADVPSLYALTGVLMRVSRTLALHMDPEALVLIAGKNRRRGNHTPAIMGPVDVERRRRLWHLILQYVNCFTAS
ncbi:hypothetical protein CISG_00760 [Coccidioides immitis RMSCC 3703]|uniref:C6 finger domain transcription factor nscR n=1 Tax=Coccidioides immitis RMSCC 3703 TaxID=454286 RepID=A0A0J8QRW4_COCIT|nr:hypothetical protein CISG_00760 [Coccidioides immitis RMSCC 3703]